MRSGGRPGIANFWRLGRSGPAGGPGPTTSGPPDPHNILKTSLSTGQSECGPVQIRGPVPDGAPDRSGSQVFGDNLCTRCLWPANAHPSRTRGPSGPGPLTATGHTLSVRILPSSIRRDWQDKHVPKHAGTTFRDYCDEQALRQDRDSPRSSRIRFDLISTCFR